MATEEKIMSKTILRYRGPYLYKSGTCVGRKFMVVVYSDGSKGTTLYSRYLMEQKLGRRLHPTLETVDHINRDKTDDRLENLQLLPKSEHTSKDAKPAEIVRVICPWCGVEFSAQARQIRHTQGKLCKKGPYCSRSCAGSASHLR